MLGAIKPRNVFFWTMDVVEPNIYTESHRNDADEQVVELHNDDRSQYDHVLNTSEIPNAVDSTSMTTIIPSRVQIYLTLYLKSGC